MPDTGGRPIIEVVQEYEEHNYMASVALLGDTVGVAEQLSSLYDLFPRAFHEANLAPEDHYISPLIFLLSCQYQLAVANLAALRGHLTDSIQATRRAVESCAFAKKIADNPHLALVWLRAGESDEAYEAYRKKFAKLFPQEAPLMARLRERYDSASRQMHSSAYSFASRLKRSEGDSATNIDFNYFEIDSADPSEPVRTLLWVWDTHFLIIQVFADILGDAIAALKTVWEMRRTTFDAALAYHKEKWRATIFADAKAATTEVKVDRTSQYQDTNEGNPSQP